MPPSWGTQAPGLPHSAARSRWILFFQHPLWRSRQALYAARRYGEAATVFSQGIDVDPNFKLTYAFRGLALYGLGDLEKARDSCESQRDDWLSQVCLAIVYNKLGRRADAEAVLAKLKAAQGDDAAYQYAQIYAQWGARPKH